MTPATLIRIAYGKLVNNSVGPVQEEERFVFNRTYGFGGMGTEDGTRVRGGPDWIRSDQYAITAVAQGRVDARTLAGPMLLALFENRFRLKVHVQSEEFPVWSLKAAKDGLKIKSAEQGSCVPRPDIDFLDVEAWKQFEAGMGGKPYCQYITEEILPNYRHTTVGGTMRELANQLSIVAFHPPGMNRLALVADLDGLRVLNMTGIPDTQRFNFVLEYGLDPGAAALFQRRPDQLDAPLGPTIFDALKKLGLMLERGKAPREYLVIDHIERPSEN